MTSELNGWLGRFGYKNSRPCTRKLIGMCYVLFKLDQVGIKLGQSRIQVSLGFSDCFWVESVRYDTVWV